MVEMKTIHLNDYHRLNNDVVEGLSIIDYDEETGCPNYGWTPTKYKIGEQVMLVSHTGVSPNDIRRDPVDRYSLVFDASDGIPGNSNRNITRYHGWRGTTDDVSCYAHGLRKIIKIRELKNGAVAVTVGADLTPLEA